ncbi:MAG: dienelactone hydrolase family protein [Opitutaceae bacterium]|nr:dienelactone hydrolase family protein [Opitutaceae bacterium]
MKARFIVALLLAFTLAARLPGAEPETLPPLKDREAPSTYEALWAGYDPRREPLEIETLKEWEEEGVVLRVVRYRIGVFKGQRAMMAGVYGFPKGGSKLPALLNIHGGGQYADAKAVLTNAKRGYATLTLAWAGRIAAPGYSVNPEVVQLFWDGKTADSKYKLTTDWGALDAYHAPHRNPANGFAFTKPAAWTLDAVDSPRNNPWFLVTLGARRGLTFLEQQPEVDGSRLGVYGHSMGGKLTVLTTAADNRVKAAAPSCGGVSNRATGNALYDAILADDVSLKRITCPIIFLSPSNDFHGRIDDLQKALHEIQSKEWRATCSPHHNHQDTAPYMINGLLWMDQHLKGTFTFPQSPQATLTLQTSSGVPSFSVRPDASKPVLAVDIYYTQHGQMDGKKDDNENSRRRFWHHAVATKSGDTWTADLPLGSTDRPLWVYANVVYPLNRPETGASYYYRVYTAESFTLSSPTSLISSAQLKANGVRATLAPSLLIESFARGWEKEWFTYKPEEWGRTTHKLHDDRWHAPANAKLAIEIRSEKPNKVVVGIDAHAAEIQLRGGGEWQSVILSPADFKDAVGVSLPGWVGIRSLRLGAADKLESGPRNTKQTVQLGGKWEGAPPEFRNLRWTVESAPQSTRL